MEMLIAISCKYMSVFFVFPLFFLDPKKDKSIEIDGLKVVVPQGKPVAQPKFQHSSFSQSEYLVYREDQCRIRFILKLKFY